MRDVLRPHKKVLGLSSILDKLQWARTQLLGTYPGLLLHMQTGLYLHDFRLLLLHMRSSLFWDFMQRRLIVNYQSSYFISMLITVGQVQKSGMLFAFQFSDSESMDPYMCIKILQGDLNEAENKTVVYRFCDFTWEQVSIKSVAFPACPSTSRNNIL